MHIRNVLEELIMVVVKILNVGGRGAKGRGGGVWVNCEELKRG